MLLAFVRESHPKPSVDSMHKFIIKVSRSLCLHVKIEICIFYCHSHQYTVQWLAVAMPQPQVTKGHSYDTNTWLPMEICVYSVITHKHLGVIILDSESWHRQCVSCLFTTLGEYMNWVETTSMECCNTKYFKNHFQINNIGRGKITGKTWVMYTNTKTTLIARFMGPTWVPSGADRTQVGPMLVPWTLLSGKKW